VYVDFNGLNEIMQYRERLTGGYDNDGCVYVDINFRVAATSAAYLSPPCLLPRVRV